MKFFAEDANEFYKVCRVFTEREIYNTDENKVYVTGYVKIVEHKDGNIHVFYYSDMKSTFALHSLRTIIPKLE